MPAAVDTRPICAAGYPSWIRRMVTTKKQALTRRLLVPDHTSSVRKKGWCQTKRKPSLTCSTGETAAPERGFGRRSVRSRLSVKQETAYDSASNRNGAHARTAYSRPPSGPPSSEAMCWRAWAWLYAVARSSSRTTLRIAAICAGWKTPWATPVSSATTARWGTVSAPSQPATARLP